jgi:hypothetical protein
MLKKQILFVIDEATISLGEMKVAVGIILV